jgi:quinol monooxygenase YgiN
MTTISIEYKILTLVNVFTVAPDKQNELTRLLIEATGETMKHLPGFISANIHKSLDGTRVVNYAQWNSREDFEAMLRNPKALPHLQACAALAKFDPIVCEVADSISINTDDLTR